MKYNNITPQAHQKQKETLKQNVLNIINIVKKNAADTPKQKSLYTSLNSNNEADEVKGLSASNSFRPQLFLQPKKKESLKDKGNNQINIRLNINSEIINNNYPKDSTKKAPRVSNSTKEDLIKEKDRTIQELEKEILNTKKLVSKLRRDNAIQETNTRIDSEVKGLINMMNYNTLSWKTKQAKQLSGKFFFQNLMKSSRTLNKTLMRKKRFVSPKCFSSSSAYLENESRPNSPFDTHSVKSEKNNSVKPKLKRKDISLKSQSNKLKIKSITTQQSKQRGAQHRMNQSNSQMMNSLFMLKERIAKVFEQYDVITFDSVLNCKSQQGFSPKVLIQNYIKDN